MKNNHKIIKVTSTLSQIGNVNKTEVAYGRG